MIIKNKKEMATTETRRLILDLLEVGIKRVLPNELIPGALCYSEKINTVTIINKNYHLINGRIFLIGGGKASGLMAEAVEKIIGPANITAGIVNASKGDYQLSKINIIEAGHPLPDKKGEKGIKRILGLKEKYKINERDLVLCLISGGGSAMLPGPVKGVSLKEKQTTTELLIKSGAPIEDINAVRKHLSRVKGGKLAKHFAPARVVSLIISDVVSNNLDVIASGPTVPDPKTFKDAWYVLEKYQLLDKVPDSVRYYLERGQNNRAEETPKHLNNANNYIIGKNAMALEAMAYDARKNNFKPLMVTHKLTGEPKAAAKRITEEIKYGRYKEYDMLLFGGETTPRVPDNAGSGGRNQHLAAAMMLAMQQYQGEWLVASIGTDGQDYDTSVAGAIVDNFIYDRLHEKNLDVKEYLENFDTFNLFRKLGQSQIITGDTGTNVGDVMVILLL
jgi:glycerate-2-kinase